MAYAASSGLFLDDDGNVSLPHTLVGNIMGAQSAKQSAGWAIQSTIQTDTFARAKSMMRYAAKGMDDTREGGYIRGFPTSNMNLITVEPAAIEDALTRAVGAYDNILVTYKGSWNERFFLSKALQDVYMDPQYFPWGDPPAETHWSDDLEEIQIPIVNPDTGEYYTSNNEYEHSRYTPFFLGEDLYEFFGPDEYALYAPDATEEYTIKFPYVDNNGDDQLWQVNDTITVGDVASFDWIMVAYQVDGKTYYWAYKIDSGEDPTFEAAIDKTEKEGSFLPVAVLMHDKVWFDEDPDSQLAITTNRLMKKLATSGTEIKEDFLEQEEEDNASGDGDKSNAEKWDFFVHFAVPIDTYVRGSKEYLWYFFEELQEWSTVKSDSYYDYLANPSSSQPFNEIIITEAGDTGYNVAYRWSYIERKSFNGDFIIEDPNSEPVERPLKPKEIHTQIVQRGKVVSAEYQAIVDEFFGPGTPIGPYNNPDKKKDDDNGFHDFFVITRQREDDTGYDRMLVMSLSMEYKINTSETDEGKKGYRYRYAQPRLFGTDEETKEFRIPLLWSALKKVPTIHREEACADGLTATVFLVEVVKIKWYQSGFFKWFFIILAITLIIVSIWFPALLEVAIIMLGGVLGGSAFAMVVAYMILSFAVGMIISMGLSVMSPQMQQIFAIVMIAAMIYTGQFQSIRTSFAALRANPTWLGAANMINATSSIYDMGFSVYSQYTIDKYEDEFRDLLKDQRERQMELEDAWAGLGETGSYVDPLDLARRMRYPPAEEPSDYYSRTLLATPGLEQYRILSEFNTIAVSLPEYAGQKTIIDGIFQDFEGQRG